MPNGAFGFCLGEFRSVERPPRRVAASLPIDCLLERDSFQNRRLLLGKRPMVRTAPGRWVRKLNAIVLPPTDPADFIRSVSIGENRETTRRARHVFSRLSELNIQCSASRAIDQQTIANRLTAPMALADRCRYVSRHTFGIDQRASRRFPKRSYELQPASHGYAGKRLFVTAGDG
jgi:hypothetical protein